KIDLSDETSEVVFPENRAGLSDIVALGNDFIATSESHASQVIILAAETGEQIAEVPVKGSPYGLATYGQCVISVSDDAKSLAFIKVTERAELIAEWDVSAAGDRLKQPRRIAIDQATGDIYLRS